jgi:hypothetical protein
MFAVSLQRDGHLRRYSISLHVPGGWEVKLEADRHVARHEHYHDWHRVERVREVFAHEVSELRARGWQIVGESVVRD